MSSLDNAITSKSTYFRLYLFPSLEEFVLTIFFLILPLTGTSRWWMSEATTSLTWPLFLTERSKRAYSPFWALTVSSKFGGNPWCLLVIWRKNLKIIFDAMPAFLLVPARSLSPSSRKFFSSRDKEVGDSFGTGKKFSSNEDDFLNNIDAKNVY